MQGAGAETTRCGRRIFFGVQQQDPRVGLGFQQRAADREPRRRLEGGARKRHVVGVASPLQRTGGLEPEHQRSRVGARLRAPERTQKTGALRQGLDQRDSQIRAEERQNETRRARARAHVAHRQVRLEPAREHRRVGHEQVDELVFRFRRGEIELAVPLPQRCEEFDDERPAGRRRGRSERLDDGGDAPFGLGSLVQNTILPLAAGFADDTRKMVDFAPLHALVAAQGAAPGRIEPMPGGASTRKYYRVGLGERSAVAMFVPDGNQAEEIGKGHATVRWPFLEVRELLEARGVHVPRILGEDCESGWLLIEDLGDDTLANYLLAHPEQKSALYTRAVQDLARAQLALAELPLESVVQKRAFDEDLLRWEIEHFREWAVDARGFAFSPDDSAAFGGLAARFAKRVAALPRGFVHRDYQSRNLMVRAGTELVWLDFQDALLGPRAYDLVALLGDSYQEFDRAFIEARQDEYASALGLSEVERGALSHEFDLITVQRKLKDAGRFVFIDRVKHNPSFLPFVTPTIHKVMAAVAHLGDHDDDARILGAILRRTLPDEVA